MKNLPHTTSAPLTSGTNTSGGQTNEDSAPKVEIKTEIKTEAQSIATKPPPEKKPRLV